MEPIAVETLRTWLEEGRPVTILDVRPANQRADWAIPGSVHLDAYRAQKADDRLAGRPVRRIGIEVAAVEAGGVPGLREQLARLRRIVGVGRQRQRELERPRQSVRDRLTGPNTAGLRGFAVSSTGMLIVDRPPPIGIWRGS